MANLLIIKDLCRKKNITQSELASRVGITPAGLQKLFNTNSTKIETLESIAKVLNVPITTFFDDSVKEASSDLDKEKLLKENIELYRENKELRDRVADLEGTYRPLKNDTKQTTNYQ